MFAKLSEAAKVVKDNMLERRWPVFNKMLTSAGLSCTKRAAKSDILEMGWPRDLLLLEHIAKICVLRKGEVRKVFEISEWSENLIK